MHNRFLNARTVCSLSLMIAMHVSGGGALAQEQGDDGGIAAVPAGSAFSFQGKLNQGGQNFTGQAQFGFSLYDAPTGGVFLGNSVPSSPILAVTTGLFNAQIDFGTPAFVSQSARWMEISVRVPPNTGSWVTLSPRQRISPAPVAIYALNGAGLTLPFNGIGAVANPLFYITNNDIGGIGVRGDAPLFGVQGRSASIAGAGVSGHNLASGNTAYLGGYSHAIYGISSGFNSGHGVYGENSAVYAGAGVSGRHVLSGSFGELGHPLFGVYGFGATGVRGQGDGTSATSYGVEGINTGCVGRLGTSTAGVYGESNIPGLSAVEGVSVDPTMNTTIGRLGYYATGVGISPSAVFGSSPHLAGRFEGRVEISHNSSLYSPLWIRNQSSDSSAIGLKVLANSGIALYAGSSTGHAAHFDGDIFVGSSDRVGLGVFAPAFQLHLSQNSAAKPTSNTWTISSDQRLKKNIHDLDGALDKLLELRGVTYQWINPDSQGGMNGTYTGMIAQDVERVFPEWVNTDPDGYKTLTVIGFEGLVVEALRDLRREKNAEIADLNEQLNGKDVQIEQLHAAHDSLRGRMEAMERAIQTLSQNN